jgi:uncharacterized membrane protein
MGSTYSITTTTPNQVRQYQAIQSAYASYAPLGDAEQALRTTNAKLRVPRPKTVTESDIHQERKAIVTPKTPPLLVLQLALATLVVCLLVYVFVPAPYAHGIALLVLSVGIAVGIFLSK